MRKALSIFLLAIFMMSSTQFNELLKLPMLVSHYLTHMTEDSDTNLIGFLYMHYGQGNVKDKDYEDDMKLPFKAPCPTMTVQVHALPTIVQFLGSSFSLEIIEQNDEFIHPLFYSYTTLGIIWQPPKFA